MDYQLTGERFDAVASIGMVEHVGSVQIDRYAQQLSGLLEPGGRLLNHGIARLRPGDAEAGPFSERYVFPDAGAAAPLAVLAALERAGFATEHVYGFTADYPETLTHWLTRLEDHLEEAVRLAGEQRVRVWGIYLRAARTGFQTGFTSVYQVRAHLARRTGGSCPWARQGEPPCSSCSRTAVCGRAPAGPRPDPPTREP
jgi:cyclopropane-fatty-acyl-phospholipid synthase